MQLLSEWENFYVIVGSSAAALTGLMFVVVTLIAGRTPGDGNQRGTATATFSTPTVVHLSAAFILAGILSAPWKTIEPPSILIALVGIVGSSYVSRVTQGTRILEAADFYAADLEDKIWHSLLPFVAYSGSAVAAAFLPRVPAAMFAIATASMLFILIGIHNAWDTVTFIVLRDEEEK